MSWFKIDRQIFENEIWFLEPFSKAQAWIDLVGNANHKPNSFFIRGNEVKVGRGQLGWSELTMTKRWHWGRNKVRGFLQWLENRQQITQRKDRFITTIITINNYNRYQGDTADDTAERQQKDSRRDINKNDKNDNNEKNKEEHIKKPNRVFLSRFQTMAILKEFPGLVTSELKEQTEKCNNYMAISSVDYTNPGLFLKGWLRKYMGEKKKDEAEKERNDRFEKALPSLTEEQIKENQERLDRMKKEMANKGVIF